MRLFKRAEPHECRAVSDPLLAARICLKCAAFVVSRGGQVLRCTRCGGDAETGPGAVHYLDALYAAHRKLEVTA